MSHRCCSARRGAGGGVTGAPSTPLSAAAITAADSRARRLAIPRIPSAWPALAAVPVQPQQPALQARAGRRSVDQNALDSTQHDQNALDSSETSALTC